jgi:hypothetical protein
VRATGRDAQGAAVALAGAFEVPAGAHGSPALSALWASARAHDALGEDEGALVALSHRVVGPGTGAWLGDASGAGVPLRRAHTTAWTLARSSARAAKRNVVPTAIAPVGAPQPPRAIGPAGGAGGASIGLDVQALDDGPADSTQRYDGAAYARAVERRLAARERIDAGLRFLARCQSAAGAWSDVETTRLVLAAFRSAGETARRGRYRRQLARAEAWLARGANVRSSPTMQPLTKLIAAQVLGGPNDGAVLGHGDAIAMTAMLVNGLVLSEAGAL